MKKKEKKAGESETGLPGSYYNWGRKLKEGTSVEESKNSLGMTEKSFKDYLKAWKKKWMDPEKE